MRGGADGGTVVAVRRGIWPEDTVWAVVRRHSSPLWMQSSLVASLHMALQRHGHARQRPWKQPTSQRQHALLATPLSCAPAALAHHTLTCVTRHVSCPWPTCRTGAVRDVAPHAQHAGAQVRVGVGAALPGGHLCGPLGQVRTSGEWCGAWRRRRQGSSSRRAHGQVRTDQRKQQDRMALGWRGAADK